MRRNFCKAASVIGPYTHKWGVNAAVVMCCSRQCWFLTGRGGADVPQPPEDRWAGQGLGGDQSMLPWHHHPAPAVSGAAGRTAGWVPSGEVLPKQNLNNLLIASLVLVFVRPRFFWWWQPPAGRGGPVRSGVSHQHVLLQAAAHVSANTLSQSRWSSFHVVLSGHSGTPAPPYFNLET